MQFLNRKMSTLILGIACLGLISCSGFPPKIYRMDVQQGNAITPDMVNSLKKGMNKTQVQEIMGTPALTHALNANRWDYYYYFKPGNGGKIIEKHFSALFQNDRLISWK